MSSQKATIVVIMNIMSTAKLEGEIFGFFEQKPFPGIIPGHYILRPVHAAMVIDKIPPNTTGALFRVEDTSASKNISLVERIMQKLSGDWPWIIVWDEVGIPWPIKIQFENRDRKIHICRNIPEIAEQIIALQPPIVSA
jgi:hypothetical protein